MIMDTDDNERDGGTMKRFRHLPWAFALLICANGVATAEVIETKRLGGHTLKIEKLESDEIVVLFDDRKVFGTTEALSITTIDIRTIAGTEFAVLQVDSGGRACPAHFNIMAVGKDRNMATKLGNCSDLPVIGSEGNRITLSLPAIGGAAAVAYAFDGKQLETITGPSAAATATAPAKTAASATVPGYRDFLFGMKADDIIAAGKRVCGIVEPMKGFISLFTCYAESGPPQRMEIAGDDRGGASTITVELGYFQQKTFEDVTQILREKYGVTSEPTAAERESFSRRRQNEISFFFGNGQVEFAILQGRDRTQPGMVMTYRREDVAKAHLDRVRPKKSNF